MQKLRILFLLVLLPSIIFAQQRTKIILQSSTSLKVDTKSNINYVKNPVFKQDNAILTCDSAVFYKDRNFFEAYRNVHINQGDTVNIYSDFLDYDGNKKLANLNSNVRMVDATSILTTNKLIYFMDTKIGRYVDGGKIVNKGDVTITSKNAWYFSNSRDAWFRYNVIVVTPQSTIKSDTLRYNTLTNWTYFYGPTNIKGKDDNLYTENGSYNTKTENAFFGKKNLYTQGTKSLKGDSLFYNGKTGYGKAIKNIVFKDTSDKTILYGQLGEYYKLDERIVVTENAYFGMGTKDSAMIGGKKIPDTLWLGADTLEAQKVLQHTLKLLKKPVIEKDNEVGIEDELTKEAKEKEKAEAKKLAATETEELKKTTTVTKASTKKLSKKEQREADKKAKEILTNPPPATIDSLKNNIVSKADSIKPNLLADKDKPILQKDTIKVDKKASNVKENLKSPLAKNTLLNGKLDTTKKILIDSAATNPLDTVRARTIKAFHNVRVYKSNMQAKADSLFYTSADSTLRWYKNPILWGEGSQQTGDTIHVFFKNDKIHSFQVLQNGFIVNVETDSTKFNQVKGKKITGIFTDGELRNMYVDGNAESIYYSKDSKGEYDNLSQSVSGRIKFSFKSKELTDILFIKEDEGITYPIDKLPKSTTLTGFIWKPELRPVSKADIIKGLPKSKTIIPKNAKASPKKASSPTKPVTKSAGSKDESGIRPILPNKKVDEVKPKVDSLTKPVSIDTNKKSY